MDHRIIHSKESGQPSVSYQTGNAPQLLILKGLRQKNAINLKKEEEVQILQINKFNECGDT